MPPGPHFTDEEDMAMWRFAMEEHPGYGKYNMWELFIKTTGSKRTTHSLYVRFFQILLPYLSKTNFHVETKLMLCQKYDVKVGDEFLKELKKDAEVELNEERTVNSYQLKPYCPKNRDLEMDDKEFTGIMPLIAKWKQWTSGYDTAVWSYVLKNCEKYTRGSKTFWKGLIAKMKWNYTPNALLTRFLTKMAPNLHKKNLPIEQKLELYKRCQVPVERKYLETLKEHAELKIDQIGCITEYKMKTGRPEKRKNAEGTSGHVKKAKRVVLEEQSDDQDEDEDMGFDDIVSETDTRKAKKARKDGPGTSVKVREDRADIFDDIVPNAGRDHQEAQEDEDLVFDDIVPEEDDLILDNVVDRGWTNPDMIIRKPPKIEVDEDEDDPAVEELDDMFIQKEELFDEMNVEYAEMVHGCRGQGFEVETRRSDDWNERIMNQRSEDHSDLMTKMLETMQRMEASHKEDMREVKKALETSQQQMGELSKTVVSIQSEIIMIRNKIDGIPEDAPPRKKYLLNFKNFVSSLESPELAPVEQRIDTALENLPENDQSPPPTKNLRSIFEVALTATGS